jgi:hypothetical protein
MLNFTQIIERRPKVHEQNVSGRSDERYDGTPSVAVAAHDRAKVVRRCAAKITERVGRKRAKRPTFYGVELMKRVPALECFGRQCSRRFHM